MIRVKKSRPCPICQKTDWCLLSPDGQQAFCMRIYAGAVEILTFADGSEVAKHLLSNPRPPRPSPPPPPLPATTPLASIQVRNIVYQALLYLSNATSYAVLYENLRDRGFSHEKCQEYGALPQSNADRRYLVKYLLKYLAGHNIYSLAGVPGFWTKDGETRLCPNYPTPNPYLLIPYRDPAGLIQGLQYRTEGTHKYRWLSSSRHTSGATPGKLLHYCQPFRPIESIVVTEGALKGEVYKKHFPAAAVICLDGVNTGHYQVAEWSKNRTLYIAFDMDWQTNPQVKHHLDHLMACHSGPTSQMQWENHKGIDDALEHGEEIISLPITPAK